MVRPRWQGFKLHHRARAWRRWDQALAVLAATNLAWVIFDVTYLPLRNFWLQRNLYPLPSVPLAVPLPGCRTSRRCTTRSRASNPIGTPRPT